MIFPYWEVRLDGEVRWLPLLSVVVQGQEATSLVDVLALVDSGSEYNVLGMELHADFNCPWRTARR